MKKLFIISSICLVIVLILFGVYMVAFKNNPYNPKVDNGKSKNETPSIADQGGAQNKSSSVTDVIHVINQRRTLEPKLNENENSIVYINVDTQEVQSYSINDFSTTSIMSLSGAPLHATWSPDATKVLVEMRSATETRWYLIDLSSKTETALKSGMENPVWTNSGDKILYKYYDEKTKLRSLNIALPNGTDWKEIGESPFQHMSMVSIPQTALIAFWNQGNAFEETSLQTLPFLGGRSKTLFSGKFGADYVFSPDGNRILVSSSTQKGGESLVLGLLSNQGTQYQNLLIPTLASKVVWSKDNKTTYYALPGSIPDGSVMPNDYFQKPIFTQDTFWKVDITTGEKERIVDPKDITKGFDATNLVLGNDDSTLFFVNRSDGRLYQINL